MAIDVSKALDGSFYTFNQTLKISESVLDGRLADFVSPCTVNGTYVLEGTNVYIDGIIEIDILFKCDKCLKDVRNTLKTRYMGSFYLEGTTPQEGYSSYSNNSIDITKGVEQEIILALPTKVLCDTNCKGICPNCGINLNESSCACSEDINGSQSIENSPFSVLKDLNKFSGGASNGSTKR